MCGIAGFVGEFISGFVSRMNAIQKHRGPEGLVIYFQKFLPGLRLKECFHDLVLLKQRFIGLSKRTFHWLASSSYDLSIITWEG